MVKIERKTINNKPYFYLSEVARFAGKKKKIQVYLGKKAPNDLRSAYSDLFKKELDFVTEILRTNYKDTDKITLREYINFEKARLTWKYFKLQLNKRKLEQLWRRFAIAFIFESNAIEGSKLKASEVEAIVRKKYVRKNIQRQEIQEVENALRSFEFIRSGDFKLNQRAIIALHKMITNGLGIQPGYKKHRIVVNNKDTTPPGKVRAEMAILLEWYKKEKRQTKNPFRLAILFHQRFEHIHPFEDGNGRTGRMILIWMLLQTGYDIILFKNRNKRKYFSALDDADEGREAKLVRFAMKVYRKTVDEFTQNKVTTP